MNYDVGRFDRPSYLLALAVTACLLLAWPAGLPASGVAALAQLKARQGDRFQRRGQDGPSTWHYDQARHLTQMAYVVCAFGLAVGLSIVALT